MYYWFVIVILMMYKKWREIRNFMGMMMDICLFLSVINIKFLMIVLC